MAMAAAKAPPKAATLAPAAAAESRTAKGLRRAARMPDTGAKLLRWLAVSVCAGR